MSRQPRRAALGGVTMRSALPCALLALAASAATQPAGPALAPLAPAASFPVAPWREAGLPKQTLPKTGYEVVMLDGRNVLRIESSGSYGNLVHELPAAAPAPQQLSWRWRLDRPIAGADLRGKATDDAALKVCVLFDQPLSQLPVVDATQLRLARAVSGEALPSSTLCYVWDPSLTAGQVLPNAYTRRMRWMVLQGQGSALGGWREERRDLQADFLRVFGDEARTMPRVQAVLVGADADNTAGRGLGYVADLVLR